MVIDLNEFCSRLVQAGVLDARQCKFFVEQYRKVNGGNPPAQAGQIAGFLVKKKILTPFQSSVFLKPQLIDLRLGPYLIRDSETAAPFGRFAQAARTTDGAIGVLLRAGLGNPWLAKHAAIDASNLQPFASKVIGDYETVFSAIGEGKVLSNLLSNQPWSTESVVSLGIKIANALSVMHDAGIVHGAVRADRVWIQDDGTPILLRDPSGPANPGPAKSAANESLSNDWLETIDNPSLYIAPELVLETANSDESSYPAPSSDLYSLGCLLFRLASGRYPIVGKTAQQTLDLHATEIPIELSRAIEQGEKGESLYRVLAYAMAKSPQARFADSKKLAAALTVVGKEADQNSRSEVPSQAAKQSPTQPTVEQAVKLSSIKTGNRQSPKPFVSQKLRSRPKRKSRAPWVLSGLAGVVVLQIIALSLMDPTQPVVSRRTEFVPPAVIPRVSNRTVRDSLVTDSVASELDSKSSVVPGKYQLVQDQRLLYVPPSDKTANPVTLDLLPPGPSMIVSVRLADFQRSTVGPSMLDAFSPDLPLMIESMVKRLGVPADKASRVTAALYPGNGSDSFQVALSVTLDQPQPMASLLKSWGVSVARTRQGQTIYVGERANSDAYYLPENQAETNNINRFAVGAIDLITELALIDGEPIPLPRSSRSLWDATDQAAEICVLVNSNFLFADGRSLLEQSMPQAIDPLRRFLIPRTSAFLLEANAPVQGSEMDQVYSEIRISASGGISEVSLAKLISEKVQQWPEWADQVSVNASLDQSWLPLAKRFPSMVRFITDRVRVGVDDRTAIANVYLPSVAVPQLSFASVLAMNTQDSEGIGADGISNELLTINQILGKPMSVSFGQESLEFAIDAITDSLQQQLPSGNKVPSIEIVGGDLQLMGITQNQQIRDFRKQNLPLRQVLTDLVVAANPDQSASGPADIKQSLIWVVMEAADDWRILVTTRQAAQSKEYNLPSEFQPSR